MSSPNSTKRLPSHKLSSFLRDNPTRLRLILYFLVSMVFLGALIQPEYATDTYADVMLPAGELITNFLRGGRLFTLLCFLFFRGLHVPIQLVDILSFGVAICALTAALYLLESILRKHFIHHHVWSFILPILLILNPFIIELFLFVEKGIMVLGILACVIAAYYFNQYLDSKTTRSILLAIIFVILATFCYQGTVGLFIVLATLFTVLKFKDWPTFLKNTARSVAIYAIGPIINIIFIKLFASSGRVNGEIIFQDSFFKILSGTKSLCEVFGIMPTICFWGCIIAFIIFWLIYCAKQRRLFYSLVPRTLLQIAYLLTVIYLAAIAPQAIQNTTSIWIVPRSTYAFATLFGIIVTVILNNYPRLTIKTWWQLSTYFITAVFLLSQFYGFNRIIISHYNLNALDRLRAEQLGQIISAYELEHHLTVTTITPANDASLTYSYPGLFVHGDINISAFTTEWSDISSLNFWAKRNFIRQTPDPAWQEYCASHDWSSFDDNQINFSGETLQICWY